MVHFPPIRPGIKRLVTGKHCVYSRRRTKCLREYGVHFSVARSASARGQAHAPTIARLMDPLEYSRYARQLVAAKSELREELVRAKDSGWTREAMQAFLRERHGGDEGALHSGLRTLRQRVLLRTMARDLSGTADLAEVCGTMTALAEVALEAAL